MFFVAGITGHVGGAAARRLLEEGHAVRTLARDPQKVAEWAQKGVDVRQGDFTDPAAVAGALKGVEGAYLMMPPILVPSPGYPEAKAVLASFGEALRLSPPPRLVLLSSVGSEKSSGLGNITSTHLMEEALGGLPFPTAFVRAGGFFENYIGGLDAAAATGLHYSFYQPTDRPIPMVATVDIGREVARLLVGGWDGKKIVELGSPVSPDDIACAMGEALGQPVKALAVPREQWAASLEAFGMAPGTTGLYEEMLDGFNSGWMPSASPGTEPVAGTTTAAQVFAQARKGHGYSSEGDNDADNSGRDLSAYGDLSVTVPFSLTKYTRTDNLLSAVFVFANNARYLLSSGKPIAISAVGASCCIIIAFKIACAYQIGACTVGFVRLISFRLAKF